MAQKKSPTENNQDEFYSGLMVDVFDNIYAEVLIEKKFFESFARFI